MIRFDHIARGIDWGYAADPFHYTVNHYDKTRKRLYIFYEIQKLNLSNKKAAEMIKTYIKEYCNYGSKTFLLKKVHKK